MTDKYIVPAIDRSIDVLNCLASSKNGITLHELSIKTEIPKSSLFRILYTLEKKRFVEQDLERKKFILGFKLWELGNLKIENTELASIAVKHMRELASEVCENVFLGVLDNQDIIYIQRVDCPSRIKAITKLGRRAPAYCTATGQAILANLDEFKLNEVLNHVEYKKFSSNTITSSDKLLKKLKQVRDNGFAIANGEFNSELLCVSVPLLDYSRQVIASLTVDMLATKRNTDRLQSVVKHLKNYGEIISNELGYY